MQVQTFAEQVLFGKSLEEKLNFPGEELVDSKPQALSQLPHALPRPKHLQLRSGQARAAAPSPAKLIDEKERGRLLHFFCNHELLATELMALCLLKFPDAPKSFRRGVLETLKEEQIHTRWYLHRMKQCGVEFGELPLSDYFWKSVSTMNDPLDYVTRLSLTFEQANLDYSREFAEKFQQVGDESTAAILAKIYRDEIGHVGFGLRWFRKWKAEGKTDWEAFRERLVFPLSPVRAKGQRFNREGRLEAGLDQSFIKDLQVFQQSRGRTPTVFWFNPDAEHFAALNAYDESRKVPSLVQGDLEFLPAYLSRQDDLLLLKRRPSNRFLNALQEAGFRLPEIRQTEPGGAAPEIKRKLGAIKPWAWSPDSLHFFQNSFARLTRSPKCETLWNEQIRNLYSKAWSAEWGRVFEETQAEEGWNASGLLYGQAAIDLEGIELARKHFASIGYRDIVCKAPFGTAAGANRCLMAGEKLDARFRSWCEGVLREQSAVLVEPWLNRVYDFSVQFEMRAQGLKRMAFTRLLNNKRGQFRGILCGGFARDADSELTRFLMQRSAFDQPRVYHWYEHRYAPLLEAVLRESNYFGPLGVDALVYRSREGELRLKSTVEINPRFTMGRVAYELGIRMAPGAVGLFQIVSKKQIGKAFSSSIEDYVMHLEEQHPVQLTDSDPPRIRQGSLAVTDPKLAERFLALFHVRPSLTELTELLKQF